MVKYKTRKMKNAQCRFCGLADPIKLRQGRPCCPLPNPEVRNGHCAPRQPIAKPHEAPNGVT